MAKRYDPIMCMMVDKPDKAQDAEKLHYYQHSYTKKWHVVSPDGKVFKEFNTEAEAKNYVNGKAKDAKAKDRLVKVPDNKLKEFEANLHSAGFKVVSKSDRGMTTHYQVEVNSSKKFSDKAELREWAEKIDAVCDKMDSVAPTTWNIGLTSDGKITAGLDVREMHVKDSVSALDEAIKTADGMFQQIFGKYSSAAKQHYDRAVKELDSFKGEIKDYLTLAGKWEMQIRNDLTRIDEAYNTAGNDYYAARREIQETMDSLTQVMLRKAREKRK